MKGKRLEPKEGDKRPPRSTQERSGQASKPRSSQAVPPPKSQGEKGRTPPTPAQSAALRKVKAAERKRKRTVRILIALIAVVLALLIGVLAWWKSFAERPSVEDFDPDPSENAGDITDIGPPVRAGGDRKQDFYTFLVIGRDTGGGGNTDTILLVAYDKGKQELNVMSIPRDTLVNVSWDIKKINSVYNMYGAGDKGIEALGKEIAQLVGFVPDFQVVLEWKALGELVDALGGVTYDVPRNMYYVDPTQNLTINIKKGTQKLNGSQAMQVVRFRDGPNGYANGDLGRIETQQGFLKAVVQQCLSIGNVTRINELAKVFSENVTTNLTINNLAWFADKAIFGGLRMENVSFFTMPCENGRVWSRSYKQKLSYVVPKTDELVSLVNERFNPYVDELKSFELDIMFVNSDGSIGSSTGKLEDSKANSSVGTKPSGSDSGTTDGQKPSGGSSGTTKPPAPKPEEPKPPVTEPPAEETPDTQPPDGGGGTQPPDGGTGEITPEPPVTPPITPTEPSIPTGGEPTDPSSPNGEDSQVDPAA